MGLSDTYTYHMENAKGHEILERLSRVERYTNEDETVQELLKMKSNDKLKSVYLVGLIGICYQLNHTSNDHWIVPYIRELPSIDNYMHMASLNVLCGQQQRITDDHWLIAEVMSLKPNLTTTEDQVEYCKIISNLSQFVTKNKEWIVDEIRDLSQIKNDQILVSCNLAIMAILHNDSKFKILPWIDTLIQDLKNSKTENRELIYAAILEGMGLNEFVSYNDLKSELTNIRSNMDPKVRLAGYKATFNFLSKRKLPESDYKSIELVLLELDNNEEAEFLNLYIQSLVTLDRHPKNRNEGKYRDKIYQFENSSIESIQGIYSYYLCQEIRSISFMKQMREDDEWYKPDPNAGEIISRVLKLRNRNSPYVLENYMLGLMYVILYTSSPNSIDEAYYEHLIDLRNKINENYQYYGIA